MLIFLSLMKMDTPSENSISWGGIIFVALARNVLVLRFGSAIVIAVSSHQIWLVLHEGYLPLALKKHTIEYHRIDKNDNSWSLKVCCVSYSSVSFTRDQRVSEISIVCMTSWLLGWLKALDSKLSLLITVTICWHTFAQSENTRKSL